TRVAHPPDGRGDIEARGRRVSPDQAIDIRERFAHARIAARSSPGADLAPDQPREVRATAQTEPSRRPVESGEQALLHGHKDLRHRLEYIRISTAPCRAGDRSARARSHRVAA